MSTIFVPVSAGSPGMGSPGAGALRDVARSPFPGLRPFEPEESELFFGRDDDIQDILDRLRRTRFLAVVGASGCGKSSVVRAGLVASLKDGFMAEASAPWRIVLMRPGNNPTAQLAAALCLRGALFGPSGGGVEDAAMAQATLRRGERGLVEEVEDAGLPPGSKVLVLVDQFEELFRFAQKEAVTTATTTATTATATTATAAAKAPSSSSLDAVDEARAFVKLLLAAANDETSQVYVVLTMRSEFLGDCARFPGLPDAINEGLYLLPQMSRDQFREAIVEPVRELKGSISQRLVNRMLNDLGDGADQLPVLQHALMRLWNVSQQTPTPSPIDLDDYEAMGGLHGSISKHAEETFQSLTEPQKLTAEKLFRYITDTTPDNQQIRRPLKLSRICALAAVSESDLVSVIEKFREDGRCFLMPPPPERLTGEKVIDISHESLIRQWGRLREWAEAEMRETRAYRRLVENARAWNAEGRSRSDLYSGSRLAEAAEWAAAHPDRLEQNERDFIRASRRAANLRRNRTLILLWAFCAVVVLLLAYALQKKREAERRSAEAGISATEAKSALKDAEEARKRADDQKGQLDMAYSALFSQFGGVGSSLSNDEFKERMSESLAANTALQEIPASDADMRRRAETRIRVFIKNKADEKSVDADIIEGTLTNKGFPSLDLEKSNARNAPINSVWAELDEVPIEDVKAVAYTFIRAGFQIRYIGIYPGRKLWARVNTIRVGGDPDIITGEQACRPLTVQEIKNATTLTPPMCVKP
jgi:hypothetical protein